MLVDLVHTTAVRAQENLVYAASANLVGGPERADYSSSHLDHPRDDDYLGHSVIAGPAFPPEPAFVVAALPPPFPPRPP